MNKDPKVDKFAEELDKKPRQLFEAIRETIDTSIPAVTEEMADHLPAYSHYHRIFTLRPEGDGFVVDFHQGPSLEDEKNDLDRQRYLHLDSEEDIQKKDLKDFVIQAWNADQMDD